MLAFRTCGVALIALANTRLVACAGERVKAGALRLHRLNLKQHKHSFSLHSFYRLSSVAGYSTVLLLVFGSVVFYSIFSWAELTCPWHLSGDMADTIVQQHFFLVLSSGVRYIFW